MEEKQGEVVLFGTWASNPCTRVELALKLKGIPYEYVEEDLKNKSELLLRHNPVYKKVPVLVHNGKSIAESLIILEYIECWNSTPKLLPEDPHQRAKVRFWANYYDQKVVPIFYIIFGAKGKEEREKAIEDLSQVLKVFEEEKNPKFLSWVNALKNCPLMEETLPPHEKLVAMLRVWLNSTQA
uniref:Glutathione S-transferase n=1 Tax=Quercus lobata TaxID=97700 RepID=A0A7N2LAN3_QUELO